MKKNRIGFGYVLSRLILILMLIMTFFPLVMMINMSLKPTVLITTDFLGLPTEIYTQNFDKAFDFVGRPILNSLLVCGISLVCILINVSLSGYAYSLRRQGRRGLLWWRSWTGARPLWEPDFSGHGWQCR